MFGRIYELAPRPPYIRHRSSLSFSRRINIIRGFFPPRGVYFFFRAAQLAQSIKTGSTQFFVAATLICERLKLVFLDFPGSGRAVTSFFPWRAPSLSPHRWPAFFSNKSMIHGALLPCIFTAPSLSEKDREKRALCFIQPPPNLAFLRIRRDKARVLAELRYFSAGGERRWII